MKNGKNLYNERGITFFHKTERYLNNLNVYNRSKNGTNLWDDLIRPIMNEYLVTLWSCLRWKKHVTYQKDMERINI